MKKTPLKKGFPTRYDNAYKIITKKSKLNPRRNLTKDPPQTMKHYCASLTKCSTIKHTPSQTKENNLFSLKGIWKGNSLIINFSDEQVKSQTLARNCYKQISQTGGAYRHNKFNVSQPPVFKSYLPS